jgi:hypothetical protein
MNGPEIEFDWDEGNIGHLARRSVLPEEAEQVILNDPVDLGMAIAEGEERYLKPRRHSARPRSSCGDHVAQRPNTRCNGFRTNQTAHSVLLAGTREVIHYGQETATLQD